MSAMLYFLYGSVGPLRFVVNILDWSDVWFLNIFQFIDFGNLAWKRLFTPLLVCFGGTFPPNDVTHRPNSKKDRPWAEPRHLSHKEWISAARFELGVEARKQGQCRTGKVTKRWYFTYLWRSPIEEIYIKNCLIGDVITCATFQNEKFSEVTILQGVEFSIFLLIFEWALQQCSAACDHHFYSVCDCLWPWKLLQFQRHSWNYRSCRFNLATSPVLGTPRWEWLRSNFTKIFGSGLAYGIVSLKTVILCSRFGRTPTLDRRIDGQT